MERVFIDAHDVDAGDVHVDAMRHRLAVHLRAERLVAEHHVVRNDAGAQDVARAVDVLDEGVECLDALFEAALERRPLRRAHDARQDIEGNDAFGCFILAIEREGDADAPEHQFRLAAALFEHFGRQILEPRPQMRISLTDFPVRHGHFVKRDRHTLAPNKHLLGPVVPGCKVRAKPC